MRLERVVIMLSTLTPLCCTSLRLNKVSFSFEQQPTYNTGCKPDFLVNHSDEDAFRALSELPIHIYDGLKIGYIEIHKTASTSTMSYLKSVAKSLGWEHEYETLHWRDLNEERKKDIVLNYKIFANVRDPLERFLSAASQIEAFYLMGWLVNPLSKHNVTYWQQNCYPSGAEWDHDDDKNRDLWDSITVLQRAARVDGLLRDIQKQGYWESHLFPMTSTLMHYDNDDFLKGKVKLVRLDRTSEQVIFSLLPEHIQNRPEVQSIHMGTAMASPKKERHWMLHPDELQHAAGLGKFGQQIIRSIEDLYAVDRACINLGNDNVRWNSRTVPKPAPEFDDLDFWLRTGPPSAVFNNEA